jgi:ribulose-phosphate 3-epimerase
MVRIYPAIMGINSSETAKLELLKEISDCVHIDVMDNYFVPNTTQGVELINDYATKEGFFVWVHLMVQDPIAFYKKCNFPEGSLVSFHIEACEDIFEMIKIIKEKKQRVGIAIRPKTPVEELVPFLSVADQALLMSVEPGFSGQSFLNETINKLENLVRYREASNGEFRIAMDGGINQTNIEELAMKGVDDFAVSTGIFGQANPVEALQELYHLVENAKKSV